MARILVSGGTGFIGSPLLDFFKNQGYEAVLLSRKQGKGSVFWDPEKGLACLKDFEGFDGVIHLAGEPLTLSRWSLRKRKKILSSRKEGTFFLAKIFSQVKSPPRLFLCASAVGFYGNRGEEQLTEASPAGDGFLASVCKEWEAASFPLLEKGVRVVHTRFGTVLDPSGGALKKMISVYRAGLGGRLGSGMQWMSWIERKDLIRAIFHVLNTESLSGPVNLVSPEPIRQREFAQILAQKLHRPAFFACPAWVLRLLLGDVADELLLGSIRAFPSKLLDSGFSFRCPSLKNISVA